MKKPKVSIICGVRDEIFAIRKHLNSIVHQDYPNFEVIIVDDASDDGTSEICKEYAQIYPYVSYYRIHHEEGVPASPRIFGVMKASGEILSFVEADAYYNHDYTSRCVATLLRYKNSGVVGKMLIWEPQATFVSRFKEILYRVKYNNKELVESEIAKGKIAAWVMSKKDYLKVGGYKKKAGWSADIEFTRRFMKAGYKVIYNIDAVWYHRRKEFITEIVNDRYHVGLMEYRYHKKDRRMLIQVAYYGSLILSPLFLFVSAEAFFLFVVLHLAPQAYAGIKRYVRHRPVEKSAYFLLTPVINYLENVPHAIGFIIKAITNPMEGGPDEKALH